MKVAFVILSGLFTETSGPGPELHRLGDMLLALDAIDDGSSCMYKPYSVLPQSLGEFLALFDEHDAVIPIGHSFGFAAVKWLLDQFSKLGIHGRVPITVGLDGVPNTDRFGEFFPSQMGDISDAFRWHIPPEVAAKAVQIFQRSQAFPQGTQIHAITPPPSVPPAPPATSPSHWNKNVSEFGHPDDGHCDVPADPAIQQYVCEQVQIAIVEAQQRKVA